jgi:hypothetical protein
MPGAPTRFPSDWGWAAACALGRPVGQCLCGRWRPACCPVSTGGCTAGWCAGGLPAAALNKPCATGPHAVQDFVQYQPARLEDMWRCGALPGLVVSVAKAMDRWARVSSSRGCCWGAGAAAGAGAGLSRGRAGLSAMVGCSRTPAAREGGPTRPPAVHRRQLLPSTARALGAGQGHTAHPHVTRAQSAPAVLRLLRGVGTPWGRRGPAGEWGICAAHPSAAHCFRSARSRRCHSARRCHFARPLTFPDPLAASITDRQAAVLGCPRPRTR